MRSLLSKVNVSFPYITIRPSKHCPHCSHMTSHFSVHCHPVLISIKKQSSSDCIRSDGWKISLIPSYPEIFLYCKGGICVTHSDMFLKISCWNRVFKIFSRKVWIMRWNIVYFLWNYFLSGHLFILSKKHCREPAVLNNENTNTAIYIYLNAFYQSILPC